MASATLARAASFSSGATESSRSRKLMSAATVGALARNRSFDPGEDMQERRGRLRERSDMAPIVGRPAGRGQNGGRRATRAAPAGAARPPVGGSVGGRPRAASRAIWSARSPGVSCSDSSRSNRAGSPAVNARHSGNPST